MSICMFERQSTESSNIHIRRPTNLHCSCWLSLTSITHMTHHHHHHRLACSSRTIAGSSTRCQRLPAGTSMCNAPGCRPMFWVLRSPSTVCSQHWQRWPLRWCQSSDRQLMEEAWSVVAWSSQLTLMTYSNSMIYIYSQEWFSHTVYRSFAITQVKQQQADNVVGYHICHCNSLTQIIILISWTYHRTVQAAADNRKQSTDVRHGTKADHYSAQQEQHSHCRPQHMTHGHN